MYRALFLSLALLAAGCAYQVRDKFQSVHKTTEIKDGKVVGVSTDSTTLTWSALGPGAQHTTPFELGRSHEVASRGNYVNNAGKKLENVFLMEGLYALYQVGAGYSIPGFPGTYASASDVRGRYFTAWSHWRSRGGPQGGWWEDPVSRLPRYDPPPGKEPTEEDLLKAPKLP